MTRPGLGHDSIGSHRGRCRFDGPLALQQPFQIPARNPAFGSLRNLRVIHVKPGRAGRLLGASGTEQQSLVSKIRYVFLNSKVDLVG